MLDLIKIADAYRAAHASGTPFKMPLMRFSELGTLFSMLDAD